ncbi:9305_t:CDS:2 [Racocetra fulgida]|uniref:SWR1-complex protein 5 n=1 Tax=Racocetra fulgida TaxID=60492 RepID=A0A9N8ZMW0_9GLOM|nr:9305_t:CDS:2 [Racocetra fulgida]
MSVREGKNLIADLKDLALGPDELADDLAGRPTDIDGQVIAQRKDKIDVLWTEFNEDTQEQNTSISKVDTYSGKMITISEVREFAGKLITQVPEDSEDAKAFLTSQIKDNNITQPNHMQDVSSSLKEKNLSINQISLPSDSSSSSSSIKKSQSPIASAISERGKFGKPKPTLGQLAASLSKKPKKLNTLEKSKIDWKQYVDKEGIADELKYHNKNGYVIYP